MASLSCRTRCVPASCLQPLPPPVADPMTSIPPPPMSTGSPVPQSYQPPPSCAAPAQGLQQHEPLGLHRHNWLGAHDAAVQQRLQQQQQPDVPQWAAQQQPQQQQQLFARGGNAGGNVFTDLTASQLINRPPLSQPLAAPALAMQWTGSKAPGWLRYDKKVLRFYAYFTEAVEHSPVEQSRVRRCQIRWGGVGGT